MAAPAAIRLAIALMAAVAGVASCGHRPDVRSAVARAERFLQARGASIDPMMTYVLVRLERRYGLRWTAAQRTQALAASEPTAQRRLFARLVDPSARPDPADLAATTNVSDLMVLSALYCNELGPPPAETLHAFADKPGHDVSHGAMALQWLRENGCVPDAEVAALRDRYLDGLVREASRAPDADGGIEAMAMLDYLGAPERIDAAWIDAMLAAQHADGGWGERPPDPSNDHTTALALWVLLGRSDRPAADVPWIPRS